MPKAVLKKGEEERIVAGHPWIFDNEIERIEGHPETGEGIPVFSYHRRFIGSGFFSPQSKIRIRIYSREDEKPDREFFMRRIAAAVAYRDLVVKRRSARLVFGEADLLPGLIVDKFENHLVLQTLSAGVDRYKGLIADALESIVKPEGIYERNDAQVREFEGLSLLSGTLRGSCPPETEIEENGIRFVVDLAAGQKTGHFLDQAENHAAIAPFVSGRRVLDAFCHTGGFGIGCAVAGAARVTLLDRSEHALATAQQAAVMNGVADRVTTQRGEAMEALERMVGAGQRFGVVITDPPAFAKTRKDQPAALRAYGKLARLAATLTERGGFLFIASCSHHVSPGEFADAVAWGVHRARRDARILHMGGAGPDHPLHPMLPESQYLKGMLLHLP